MKKQLLLQKRCISQYADFVLRVNYFDWVKLTNKELKSQLHLCGQSNYSNIYSLYCQETKVITGRNGGNFAPQESATRAEVAAVIERFIKTILK